MIHKYINSRALRLQFFSIHAKLRRVLKRPPSRQIVWEALTRKIIRDILFETSNGKRKEKHPHPPTYIIIHINKRVACVRSHVCTMYPRGGNMMGVCRIQFRPYRQLRVNVRDCGAAIVWLLRSLLKTHKPPFAFYLVFIGRFCVLGWRWGGKSMGARLGLGFQSVWGVKILDKSNSDSRNSSWMFVSWLIWGWGRMMSVSVSVYVFVLLCFCMLMFGFVKVINTEYMREFQYWCKLTMGFILSVFWCG